MSGFEVSTTGLAHFASWRCETCDCGSGNRFITRQLGEAGKPSEAAEVRQEAVDHLKLTGHQVSFSRGMAEILNPLATERQP